LSANDVRNLSAEFEKVSKAHIDAWNNMTDAMAQLYTDDVKYYKDGNNPLVTGNHSLLSLNYEAISGLPALEGRQAGIFIGREDGFDIWEMNYWTDKGFSFSKENPAIAYDWLTLRNGKILSWYLFWDFKVNTALGLTFNQKPLQDYASAWSSGDPEAVASLYAPDVVRLDTLFGYNQQGSTAVKDFAANFFSWYPGVRLELLQSFKLFDSNPVMAGGVYAIHVSDQAGKPCDVRVIILLEISQDKITKEWMFYNADSLIACG
jgi:uncharacterized protein (TIGR02246 family)